ncbi:MAG: Calx-beta domain-containing protein, partial [Candidatus Dormibacteraceae bacterium]
MTAVPAAGGGVYISGSFTNIGGQTVNHLARLADDGSMDPLFSSPLVATNTALLLAVQADNKPIVFGSIPNPAGPSSTNLFRFNLDGSLDASFQSGLGAIRVSNVLLQPDGKLLTIANAGIGSYLLGPAQLLRLNTNGTVDSEFNASFDFPGFFSSATLSGLDLQGDGKIVVAGTFLRADGVARGKIARLQADGSLDYCFDAPLAAELNLFSLAIDPAGRIVLGGFFSGLQGQAHPYLMRLIPPPACAAAKIGLAVPSLITRQDALEARVPLFRQGGDDLEQSVAFTTRVGTAVGGTDYEAVSGSVEFSPGQRSGYLTVPLLPSALGGPKTFEVVIT